MTHGLALTQLYLNSLDAGEALRSPLHANPSFSRDGLCFTSSSFTPTSTLSAISLLQ